MAPDRVDTGTISLPHTTGSASVARGQLEQDLRATGLMEDAVDASVLVVSEILSNALKHARPLPDGRVRLDWSVEGRRVEVRVTDGGAPTRPRLQNARATSASGRGLGIVRELTSDWGVREEGAETTVWAVIDLDRREITRRS